LKVLNWFVDDTTRSDKNVSLTTPKPS
jgi:hypothetical protein